MIIFFCSNTEQDRSPFWSLLAIAICYLPFSGDGSAVRETDEPRGTDRSSAPGGGVRVVGLVYGRVVTVVVVLSWGGVKGNQPVEVQSALFLPGSGNCLFHGSPAAGRSAILRIFGRGKKRKNSFPINFFY